MRSKSKLTFGELLGTMAVCLTGIMIVVLAAAELARIDHEREAAARSDAGATWGERQ